MSIFSPSTLCKHLIRHPMTLASHGWRAVSVVVRSFKKCFKILVWIPAVPVIRDMKWTWFLSFSISSEKMDAWSVSVLTVGGSGSTEGPQHLVQSLGCSRCMRESWNGWSVSCLPGNFLDPLPRHRHRSLLPYLSSTRHKGSIPACLSTAFSGGLWAACWKHPHICPSRDTARDRTQSIVVGWWAPSHTFDCAYIHGLPEFPHSVLLVLVLFLYNYPDSFVLNRLWLDTVDLQGESAMKTKVSHNFYLKLLIFMDVTHISTCKLELILTQHHSKSCDLTGSVVPSVSRDWVYLVAKKLALMPSVLFQRFLSEFALWCPALQHVPDSQTVSQAHRTCCFLKPFSYWTTGDVQTEPFLKVNKGFLIRNTF